MTLQVSGMQSERGTHNEFDDLVSIAATLIDCSQSIRLATTVVVRRGFIAPRMARRSKPRTAGNDAVEEV